MKKLLLNIFTDDKMIKNKISFSVILLILLFSVNIKAQHFESVTITGVASGDGSQNALFIVTCPTVPSLTRMRVEKVSGAGTVVIARQTAPAARTDNFTYLHNTGFTSGIPNNVSRMKITFLQADGVTPIPANDFRLVIDDIDGPNNEGIYTDCGSSVRYTATAIPTDLTVNTTPPNLGAVGTANENSGAPSRVMFEYNDVSSIFYTIYANNGFVKEFDLNYDDFTITAPRYAVCTGDNDGDGVSDNLDMDDDNDGILDTVECGGNNPNGDHDGDGLPNYLDTVDNTGQNAVYIANADGSVTNYTDADGDGVPDVYDSSADSDSLPNHLDLDSDGDGCYDAVEGDENVTPTQLLGTGTINIASNGGVGTTVNVNNGVPNLVNSGGAADIGADVGQGIGNSLNASLKDPLCYNLTLTSDSGATATGTAGVAFTVPNVLTNDTLDGVTPVIGSNPGQVAISQSGVWPAGITLNTATGQVNVGSSIPAGTYNVTYQVCVNGTSPVLCKTTTVTIILKADSDGDLLADDIDLDDDNDGILDTVENNCPPLVNLTNSNTNFSTLLAAGTVTVGGVNITATRTGTVNSFNGDAYIGAGAHINPGFSGTYTNAGGTSFNTPITSASLTLNFSQPISTFTASFKAMQDEEQITFSQPASSVVNLMNSTYGVVPSIMSLATLVNGGLELRSNLSGIVNSNTSSSFGSNCVVTWNFPVPVSSLTINHTGVNRGTGVGLTNYNGSIIGGDFTFAKSVTCTPLDTDGDGIINSLDTDSDGDGCPDAIEGAANITTSQVTSGHINGAVDANGVPTAVSGGQAIGQSQDSAKNDCSDVDADGVPDWQDLDDDNDGILDTVEAPCTSTQAQWSHNASGGQSDFVTFENDTTTTSPNFTSGANITFGAGLDEATDNYSYTYLLRGASTTNFADAKTANDYAQVSYTPSKKMTLKSLNFGYYSNSATDPEFNCGNFRMAVEYSTNPSFTSPILLLNDVQVGAMIAGGYVSINNAINNLVLQSGNTYYFRIYLYNEQNADANNRVRVDDVFFNHCLFVDTDGDGISDDLDTDADGDGCPDAIEGAGNITSSQVTAGHINGGVDANGVPTAVSGGQGIGNSINAALKDPACYTLTLTNNTASGTSGTAFNIPTVLGNDTLDGITPVIGTNPGQVAISQTGVWPAGITLNPDGTVSVGAGVPAGNYTVTYQVCVNGTSPALCSTTTVIIDLAQGCQAGNVSPVLHKN